VDKLKLDKLSVDELLELKAKIELTVRAAIRERNGSKLIASNPVEAVPAKTIDLQSEAWAWYSCYLPSLEEHYAIQ
jgi:hypothetical protein